MRLSFLSRPLITMSHRFLPYILGLLTFTCSLSSCQNDEYIGEIYGQWLLTDIQTPDTVATPRDLFLAFQSNVIFIRIASADAHYSGGFKGIWSKTQDSLYISFIADEAGMTNITDNLRTRFAITSNANDLRFGLRSTSGSMTLTQGNSSWHFRKY